MSKGNSVRNNHDSLPVLWVRSMFGLQSAIHANFQKMTSPFVPYPIEQREDDYFRDMHDGYESFVIDLVSHWPQYSPWSFLEKKPHQTDCDIVKAATAKGK